MLTRLFLFMSPCPCKNMLCLYKCYFGVFLKEYYYKTFNYVSSFGKKINQKEDKNMVWQIFSDPFF